MSERTAQRMLRAMTEAFPHSVRICDGDDRKRRWSIEEVPLARLRLAGADELEAIESAIVALRDRGDVRQGRALSDLRNRLLAALPPSAARAAEADADAMLEAHGVAARPGPVVQIEQVISERVAAAVRGPYRMLFSYAGERREVEPYGILIGTRRYLVARQPQKGPQYRHFRLDRITDATVTDTWFVRDPDFNIAEHAARAFGTYQNEGEYGEVIWRFSAKAADRAAEWRFHPSQTMERLPDGRLEVHFFASGWLEMAWHLYCWGNSVEVVAPKELKALIEGTKKSFGVFP